MKLLISILCVVLDCLASTLLLVRGNQWNSFRKSLSEYSFSTSFVDLCFFAYLRGGIVIGAVIGILWNFKDGPERCKKSMWIVTVISCINAYYACAKLLAFSEDDQFVAGPKLYWFWALFAWSMAGSFMSVFLWNLLSLLQKQVVKVAAPDEESVASEQRPLLFDHEKLNNDMYCSINDGENPTNPLIADFGDGFKADLSGESGDVSDSYQNSDSQSGSSDQKDGKKKTKEEKKDFGQLLNKATLGALLKYSLPDWPLILSGFIFLIAASVAEVFLPLYTGKVISGIVVAKSSSEFTKNILIMAVISVIASICTGIRGGCFKNAIQRLNIRIRNTLFSSIINQEIGFFDNMRTGDLTSRLTSDTTTMSSTLGLNCNIFLRNLIQAIGVCVFMFALSWRMSIVSFMGLPLVFAVSKVYGKYYKKLQKRVQDRFAIANEVAEEVCSSMQTVRSFANEKGEKSRYGDKLNDVYKVQVKQAISYSGYIWCTENIELMLIVGTLWFGGQLLMKSMLTPANFISFILYQESLGECMNNIGEVYTGLMQALGAAEKVFELIERKPKLSTEDGTETPEVITGRLSFKNVNFSYPTRPDRTVLKDVSFDVEPGEVVALVGPSGGGKSSCVKLLQRFYDPDSGSVLLDGKPVSSYEHDFLHEKISLVGQEPVLYARSVHDNIVYGLDTTHFTEQVVIDASIKANAHNFIMDLPEKYETETGEKGTQLSGGQKQRVAIARALVRNPRVLLLDEATSALDTESEYLVQEALERSKSHRTVLLIAHRLSTVERADRIVVIEKGQVEEIGSHEELMKKQGMYYKLVHRQLHNSVKPNHAEISYDAMSDDENTIPALDTELIANSHHSVLSSSVCHLSTSLSSSSSAASFNFDI